MKYLLADHLGSTNGLTDATGVLTASNAYDSFGNPSNANFPTRYQFTGREYDGFSGFHFYRARWYDSKLGRFISEDPIGFKGGDVNLYGYAKNNPLKYRDPSGKAVIPILAGGAVLLAEVAFHNWLADRAGRFYKDNDPWGRKKHCYVNCMSMRFHMFNPSMPNLFSLGQEAGSLAVAATGSGFGTHVWDTLGDQRANVYGQAVSFVVWRDCQELCEGCPRSSEL